MLVDVMSHKMHSCAHIHTHTCIHTHTHTRAIAAGVIEVINKGTGPQTFTAEDVSRLQQYTVAALQAWTYVVAFVTGPHTTHGETNEQNLPACCKVTTTPIRTPCAHSPISTHVQCHIRCFAIR